jgi:hypothetical protein
MIMRAISVQTRGNDFARAYFSGLDRGTRRLGAAAAGAILAGGGPAGIHDPAAIGAGPRMKFMIVFMAFMYFTGPYHE